MNRVVAFLNYRYFALGFTILLLIFLSIGTVFQGGLNMGIDFVGGVKIIAKFEKDVDEKKIRDNLQKYNPMVQQIGEEAKNEYIISTKLKKDTSSEKEATEIKKVLSQDFKNVELLSVETVGPAIGDFLRKSALKLFSIALILMTIYLAFRFEFKYSVGAMAALVHDIVLSVLFCGAMGVEVNIPVIAALLTIFGYSVNDTIVIFDRIRENVQVKTKQTFIEVINRSVSQSISRTLLTSLTTLFAVSALYFMGGEGLNDFAQVLLFGIFVGTYSSVYVASPVVLGWERAVSR